MNKRTINLMTTKTMVEENEKETLVDFYGVYHPMYENADKYLTQIPNVSDQISFCQWARNDEYNELISKYQLSEKEKMLYLDLLSKNVDLNATINMEILSSKFDFLNDLRSLITTDINVQQQLISLSDNYLALFKLLFEKICSITDDVVPLVSRILKVMGYTPFSTYLNGEHKYDEFLENISLSKEITDEEAEKILFVFSSVGAKYSVKNLSDLSFDADTLELKQIIESSDKDLNKIKFAVLLKSFGITLHQAKIICTKYDVSGLSVNEENCDTLNMFLAISKIYHETNPDILISLFNELSSSNIAADFDPLQMVTFESDLRKMFAREINDCTITAENSLNVVEVTGEFKMIVTAVGSYQTGFSSQKNYREYWNKPEIISHGNCCSLIANNNFSTSKVNDVIFGFSSMSENMLLLCSNKDINSSPDSCNFDITEKQNKMFYEPSKLIDNTRGEYNEIVYERRDLSKNPSNHKKNPDYIVFFQSFDEILDEEVSFYENSLKAANDFGVPLFVINKNRVLASETIKISKLLLEYESTLSLDVLKRVVIDLENNKNSVLYCSETLRGRYFSNEYFDEVYSKVLSIIENILEDEILQKHVKALKSFIKSEKIKLENADYTGVRAHTPNYRYDIVYKKLTDLENKRKEGINYEYEDEITITFKK